MAGAVAYEEQRRRQVEENKRKMEELRLHHLSAAVSLKIVKRKRKRVPPPVDAPVRRSDRVASLPEQPKYSYEDQDAYDDDLVEKKKMRRSGTTRRDLMNRVYARSEARQHAIFMAQEKLHQLQLGFLPLPHLSQAHDAVSYSHVTGGFWLGLPTHFCRKHLPMHDNQKITLIDEADHEFETLYLARKMGLSAGWRGFAIDHKLVDGYCLVFELINKTKFNVYIIRQNSYYE